MKKIFTIAFLCMAVAVTHAQNQNLLSGEEIVTRLFPDR